MVHIKLLHLLRHGIKFIICAHTKAYVPPHVLLPGIRSRLPSTSSCLLTSKCSSNFCNRILECRKCNIILDAGNATEYLMQKLQQNTLCGNCNRILECRKCNMIHDAGNALIFAREEEPTCSRGGDIHIHDATVGTLGTQPLE